MEILKTSKVVGVVLGLVFLANTCVWADLTTDSKMAEAVVFPHPEKPTVSLDPFIPLQIGVDNQEDTDTDEESAQAPVFSISDLKIEGIMILGAQASALVLDGNVIKKIAKNDMVHGYVIRDITTKGVEFEKDGKNVLLANPAR